MLHWWTARELATAIGRRDVSAREVMTAHLERIDAVNPRVNAIVSLRPEGSLEDADEADRRVAGGEPLGPLHGLPIAIKDLEDTAGLRTTYGSRAFAHHVPTADSLIVQRLRAAGAIVVGKTNTPEFGAGSHTFNDVFGATRNPWALDRSAGGSSGGAGAALAAGMLPIADGSDYGGSIRNPASFNNVAGLRPTPGLVPDGGIDDVWDTRRRRRTDGAHGRRPGVAAHRDRRAGPPRAAVAWGGRPPSPATSGAISPGCAWRGARTWAGCRSRPRSSRSSARARDMMVAAGCEVHDVALDLSAADQAFETLRALAFARAFGPTLDVLRRTAKQTVVWNVERGLALESEEVARAIAARSQLYLSMAELLQRFDVLVAPSAQVVPFPVEEEYPATVAGVEMPHYLGWMRVCSRITVSAHPVAAVPAGFTDGGLPVGMQMVGRYRDDRRLLEHAAAWEAASGLSARHPALD